MKNLLLIALIVLIAVLGRIFQPLYNFTPLLALGLLVGMVFRPIWLGIVAMFLAKLASDVALGFWYPDWPFQFTLAQAGIYVFFLLPICFGRYCLQPSKDWRSRAITVSIPFGMLFFLTTNFICWIGDPRYPQTLAGLIQDYGESLPFLLNQLGGDLVWTTALVLLYSWSPAFLRQPFVDWSFKLPAANLSPG